MLAAFIQIHYCWFIIFRICILLILGAGFLSHVKLTQSIVILVVSKVKSQHVLILASLMTGNLLVRNLSYISLAFARYAPYFAAIIDILDHCVASTWGFVEFDLNSSLLPVSGEKDGRSHHLANFLLTGWATLPIVQTPIQEHNCPQDIIVNLMF